MTLNEIKRLVKGGEGDHVEFKKKINHPEKVIKEVVAFANTQGGHLFVGVDDDRHIDGLSFPHEEEFILTKAIEELCRPSIPFTTEIVELNESKSILHYEIFSGEEKPYFAFQQKNHRLGRAFVRVGDKSIQASKELRKTLQKESQNKPTGFSYGQYEKQLIEYLGSHSHITLQQFCKLADLDEKEASAIVIGLAQSHVIKIIPREHEDWYVFVE